MKKTLFSFACMLFFTAFIHSQSVIKVNQLGYLTGYPKYAWVNDVLAKEISWSVKRASDNQIIYSGSQVTSEKYDSATGEKVTRIDISKIEAPGSYYLEIEDVGTSFEFLVSDTVYNDVWSAGIKSYYYQRSGMDLTPKYAGIWARKASHTKDAILYMGYANNKIIEGEYRDCRGGWYDAGDFGKKVIPACVALYSFMNFAELYPDKMSRAQVDIPNPWKGLPDMLAEAKWELDWFFTMQENNGGVHHLIVSPDFFLGPAQNDSLPRYIIGVSSAATADFAAAMAMAARVYKPYLPEFADSCLVAAKKAWDFLQNNPEIFPQTGYLDPQGIHSTGAYEDPVDKDERLWAAAELFRTTGEKLYGKYFEDHCLQFKLTNYDWWFDVHNYAFFSWLLDSHSGKDFKLEEKLKREIKNYADSISNCIESNGYGAALSPSEYNWGSNSYILDYGMELLIINNILKTKNYTEAALHQLNYILGCNSLNLCFVSGFGTHGVRDPHQSINTYDNLTIAPPGFVPGGPNFFKQDPFLIRLIEKSNPAHAKCYVDNHWSYASNEVCIPYNSGLIFLGGYFLGFPNKE